MRRASHRKYPKLKVSRRQLSVFRDRCSRRAGPHHSRRHCDSSGRRPLDLLRCRDARGSDKSISSKSRECRERKELRGYMAGQWKRDEASRVCKECVGKHEQSNHPSQCCVCNNWLPTAAFHSKWQSNRTTLRRVCLHCNERKRCQKCGVLREEAEFSAAAWRAERLCRHTCKTCARKERGSWTCASCATLRPKRCFARRTRRRGTQHGDQICDACLTERGLK